MSATTPDVRKIVRDGLPAEGGAHPKTVLIAGAGMAGLVAAYELKRAGHKPIILEAKNTVGGRVSTLREPFAPGLYAEAGAMRIPHSHDLTMAYVEKFGLETAPFTMHNPNAVCYLQGVRKRLAEIEADPSALAYALSAAEQGQSAARMWSEALRPFADQVALSADAAWVEITAKYDQYSVREFLEIQNWSEGAIERFGLLFNQEAMMNSSFLELLREEIGQYYTDMVYIRGGMDRLPGAFLPELGRDIHFGAQIVAIDQTPDQVTFHYRNEAGRFSVSAEAAIITLPFAVMRHIEVLKPFSAGKQRAIRQLHYDASAKVFIQCSRRFWEEDNEIFGGGSITDMAIRNLYYPDHGKETGRGVLLASYTWSEDAQRWGSLSPEDRIEQALENVAAIHPEVLETYETGASKMWHDDPFACGAFALFDPGQQTLLHEHIQSPEGRIHFAGEHTSLAHAWIQGAIESGLRAAWEVS